MLFVPIISLVNSGIVKLPAKSIPKKEMNAIIFDEVFIDILFNNIRVAEEKIIRNIVNPYQQAGYPKK